MLKYKNKVEKGITLIALVITIIVLLILAGISITMLSGDNSILNRAGQAKNKTELTSLKEETQTVMLGRTTEKTISGNNAKTLKEELESNVSNAIVENINATEEAEGLTDVYYVKKNGQYVTVYEDGEIEEGKVEIWDGKKIMCPELKKENNIWNWYIYTPSQLKFLADFVNNGNKLDGREDLKKEVEEAKYDINTITMTKDTIIYLMNNLDLGARQNDGTKTIGTDWTPIGINKDNVIDKLGTFEGNNHIIKGVYVNRETKCNGIFGVSNAIRNLTIKDSYIRGENTTGGITGAARGNIVNCNNKNTTVKACKLVGGIVGNTNGLVINCTNTGKIDNEDKKTEMSAFGGIVGITSNSIEKCVNNGEVCGKGTYIGGIVGYATECTVKKCINNGKVEHKHGTKGYQQDIGGIAGFIVSSVEFSECTNNGEINSNGSFTGGVIGRILPGALVQKCVNNGQITTSYNTVGGIVGYSYTTSNLTINNCYNTGNINGKSYIGGILGDSSNTSGKIKNCYNIGQLKGTSGVGGIIGNNENSSTATNSYYLPKTAISDYGNISENNYAKDKEFITTNFVNVANQDGLIWKVVTGENNGYPILIKTDE